MSNEDIDSKSDIIAAEKMMDMSAMENIEATSRKAVKKMFIASLIVSCIYWRFRQGSNLRPTA